MSFDGPSGALNRSSERRFNYGQPSMHFLGCRQSRRLRLAVPGSGREPLRRRQCPLAVACMRGTGFPSARCSTHAEGIPPATARHLAPRQSGSAPGCCRSSAKVSEGSRRPSAVSGTPLPPPKSATWRTVPCPVHLPGRCGILAAWHVGRGNPRPRPGLPDRRRIAPSASGFPDYRVFPGSRP